jgi:hypothetical protein
MTVTKERYGRDRWCEGVSGEEGSAERARYRGGEGLARETILLTTVSCLP